jgi:Zn-finger nucleic acid-binding protein
MTKCKGSNEDDSVCGRPSMYKSNYCKRHMIQDPSVSICIGKLGNGKPCFREAMTGALFCRGHRTQLGNIENLQCPRGCGQLTYRLEYKNDGYYTCQKCKGTMLDAKSVENKLSKHAGTLKDLLENGEECSLKCPRCEALMLEIRVAYKLPEGGGGGGLGNLGGLGGGGAGLLLGALVLVAVAAAAESSKSKGDRMVIDGCRDCGTFWFDAREMNTVKQSTSVEGEDEMLGLSETESAEKKAARADRVARLSVGRSANTNCMHIDDLTGKKCRRVTFRGTEYCYMHKPK